MSNKTGKLFVISAASGTGKTSVAQRLLAQDPKLKRSISYTTRVRRPNEKNGVDYFFIKERQFLSLKKKDGFLEWANVFGSFYGTPKKEIEAYEKEGNNVLLLIDVQGAKQIKKKKPEAVFIFLSAPSKDDLEKRLKARSQDSEGEIKKRLKAADQELEMLNELFLYDYRVINRSLDKACQIIQSIIKAESGL